MRRFASLLLFSLACLLVAAGPPPRGAQILWHGDQSFTAAERAEIEAGFREVHRFTSGRVLALVVWDGSRDDAPSLHRTTSAAKEVKDVDREQSDWRGHEVTVRAWATVRKPTQIWIVIDRTPHLKQTAMHELVHAAGMRRVACEHSPTNDCDHVTDESSIMSQSIKDNVLSFTTADLAFCRAAGYCP